MAYYRTPHDVTALPAWQALKLHRADMQNFSMRDAFNSNPKRFEEFTLSSCGLFLDYSKNLITNETRDLLVNLANEVDLKGAIKSLLVAKSSTPLKAVQPCTPRCAARLPTNCR